MFLGGDPLLIFRRVIPCQKVKSWGCQMVYISRSCFPSARHITGCVRWTDTSLSQRLLYAQSRTGKKLKLVNICWRYCKNKMGIPFFGAYCIYCDCSVHSALPFCRWSWNCTVFYKIYAESCELHFSWLDTFCHIQDIVYDFFVHN